MTKSWFPVPYRQFYIVLLDLEILGFLSSRVSLLQRFSEPSYCVYHFFLDVCLDLCWQQILHRSLGISKLNFGQKRKYHESVKSSTRKNQSKLFQITLFMPLNLISEYSNIYIMSLIEQVALISKRT